MVASGFPALSQDLHTANMDYNYFVIRIKSIFVCTGDTWIALGSLRTAQYSKSDNISNSKIYMSEENNMGHTFK
jgi:hypothetical protein